VSEFALTIHLLLTSYDNKYDCSDPASV